jgi:hypothetical protein
MNQLFFGDNLGVLRNHIQDESVDLIYLDPPFNSNRDYNLLFKRPKGHQSEAQITAFEDSWHWGGQAEREFDELVYALNTDQGNDRRCRLRRILRKRFGQEAPARATLDDRRIALGRASGRAPRLSAECEF